MKSSTRAAIKSSGAPIYLPRGVQDNRGGLTSTRVWRSGRHVRHYDHEEPKIKASRISLQHVLSVETHSSLLHELKVIGSDELLARFFAYNRGRARLIRPGTASSWASRVVGYCCQPGSALDGAREQLHGHHKANHRNTLLCKVSLFGCKL